MNAPSPPGHGSSVYVFFIATAAAIGGFLFGFDSGVINGTVRALTEHFGSSSLGTGFSVASMLLGCAAGAFIAGPLADRYGRRPTLIGTAFAFALSAYGSGISDNVSLFIAYRLLGGVAVGAASVLAPAYISEVSPPHLRGRLASLWQMAIVVGILSAFLSNFAISNAAGGASEKWLLGFKAYRWMFWMEVFPSVALLIGAYWIPESPRFLASTGKEAEAEAVFARLGTKDPALLVRQVKESLSQSHRPRFTDIIKKEGGLYPLVWAGIFLSIFQQFVGINVVFYYGEVLWRAAGFSESEALAVNLLSGTINVAATVVAIALIDRLGRKVLLAAGSIGMCLTLTALALCFAQGELLPDGSLQLPDGLGAVALVSANLYVFSFGVSWGPCVWVMLGEMFPNQYRGAALSVGAGVQWLANFAITMSFPVMLDRLGLAPAYGFYAASAALSLVFVLKVLKETRGRTLEEMG